MSKKRNKPVHPEPKETPQVSHEHDDDVVIVPKGQSRLQFYFILGLLIFVLLIFTVGDFVQQVVGGAFGGGGAADIEMTWIDPSTREVHELGRRDFYVEKQSLSRLASMGLFQSADPEARRGQVTDEDTAMWLILDREAQASGMEVTDSELKGYVLATFGSGDAFRQWASAYRTTTDAAQETMRRAMRVSKYKRFVESCVAVADPTEVQERWEQKHVEYAFSYVELEAADYEEEASTDLPADEELEAWYLELPEYDQREYYTDDRVDVELAWVDLGSEFDSAALLEQYPRPEEEVATELARTYYNQFSHVRFRVDPEDEEASEDGDQEEADTEAADTEVADTEVDETEDVKDPSEARDRWYQPFEDVEEVCLVEATVHAALGEWLAALQQRITDGEEVDLAVEAEGLGLTVVPAGEPRTREEFETAEGWGGRFVAGRLAFGAEAAFLPTVQVEESALVVARVVKKHPGEQPPFADIREGVAAAWGKEHAADLATEKLEALRDLFGERPEPRDDGEEDEFLPTVAAEAFTKAATDAGFEVRARPFLERHQYETPDEPGAADKLVRSSQDLFMLEPGQVPEARKSTDGAYAYLVRYEDQRTADLAGMRPAELTSIRRQLESEAARGFEEKFLLATSDYVKQRYNLKLRSWEVVEEDI